MRWIGVAVLAALGAHAVNRVVNGVPSELLWSCHVATAALGLGLVFGSWALAATGFLYHLGMGMPGYILDWATGGQFSVTSVITHVVSLAGGLLAARTQPLPRITIVHTLIGYALLLPLTMAFADPALNVNMVSKPWTPLPGIWGTTVVYLLIQLVAAAAALTFAREVYVRVRGK